LQTLDELRQQVRHSELCTFDQLTGGIRSDILSAVQDYQATTDSIEARGDESEGVTDEGVTEEDECQGQLAVQSAALHCQSLEELRAVGRPEAVCVLLFVFV
jgi:hypothetical protein